MNEIETFEFDRQGYIVIENLLDETQVAALAEAVDELERTPRSRTSPSRHASKAAGEPTTTPIPSAAITPTASEAEGKTLMIEDYWNANPAFDVFARPPADHELHPRHRQTAARPINNSEIRIRYRGNATGCHGGTVSASQKYRYSYTENGIDCMMVRMVYFIHDCTSEQGAFCVVPGTHKTNLPLAPQQRPRRRPRHGRPRGQGRRRNPLHRKPAPRPAFTNRSEQTRKTLHVGYGPYWMMSQNIATMDEKQHITPETFARLTEAQRDLFRAYPPNS